MVGCTASVDTAMLIIDYGFFNADICLSPSLVHGISGVGRKRSCVRSSSRCISTFTDDILS